MHQTYRVLTVPCPQYCQPRHQDAGDRPLQARLEAAMLFAIAWAFEPSLPQKSKPFFNILLRQVGAGQRPALTSIA